MYVHIYGIPTIHTHRMAYIQACVTMHIYIYKNYNFRQSMNHDEYVIVGYISSVTALFSLMKNCRQHRYSGGAIVLILTPVGISCRNYATAFKIFFIP